MATEERLERVLVDVTDLVEFLQRKESVSGVQRVIAETAPLILAADPTAAVIILDRPRGVFVPLTPVETDALVRRGVVAGQAVDRDHLGRGGVRRPRPRADRGARGRRPFLRGRLPGCGLDQRRADARGP